MKRGQIGLSAVAAVLAAWRIPSACGSCGWCANENCVSASWWMRGHATVQGVTPSGRPAKDEDRHRAAAGRWMHYRLDARPEAARVASQLMGILAPGVKRAPEPRTTAPGWRAVSGCAERVNASSAVWGTVRAGALR